MAPTGSSFTNRLVNLYWVILIAFGVVVVGLVYWGVLRAPTILAREDNPRLVEAELRVERGRILDRNGTPLVLSQADNGRRQERVYDLGAYSAAIGYYSLRYGTAGIEEAFDAVLRGTDRSVAEQVSDLYLHNPPSGHDVQLTLDAAAQAEANELMSGQSGALVLLELLPGNEGHAAEIRAMVSVPGYDPANLEVYFEGSATDEPTSLLNRATQGLYQPGMVLQPFLIAEATAQGVIALDEAVAMPDRPVAIDGVVTGCARLPDSGNEAQIAEATWAEVLAWGCPSPMSELGERLGMSGVTSIVEAFGLTTAPALAIQTNGVTAEPVNDPVLAAVGQDQLTITPLQAAIAWGTLTTGGTRPNARLVSAVENTDGQWESWHMESSDLIPPATDSLNAANVLAVLSGADRLSSYSATALSGPEGESNAWYLGSSPAPASKYVVAVVLENGSNGSQAEAIGQELLQWISARDTD